MSLTIGRDAALPRRSASRLYLPSTVVAGATAGLAVVGWRALGGSGGVARAMGELRGEVIGPIVVGFLAAVVAAERRWPAVHRPLASRGQRQDLLYVGVYAVAVVPLIALIGAGFFAVMERLAPWLVLPHIAFLPTWAVVVFEVLALDACNWVAHLGLHRIAALWRLHAVHHSQEELSVLTSFRTHPLVHTAYLVTALPALFLLRDGTMPTLVVAVYACLGALPHANVRCTYGRFGRVFVSPAYHRLHHAAEGRIDINLGIVLTLWDRASGRAVFPVAGDPVRATGLRGRPVPVEQVGRGGPVGILLAQWAGPFVRARSDPPGLAVTAGGQRLDSGSGDLAAAAR